MTEQELREMSNEDLIHNAFGLAFILGESLYKKGALNCTNNKFTQYDYKKELLRRLDYYNQQNNSQVPMKEHYG